MVAGLREASPERHIHLKILEVAILFVGELEGALPDGALAK